MNWEDVPLMMTKMIKKRDSSNQRLGYKLSQFGEVGYRMLLDHLVFKGLIKKNREKEVDLCAREFLGTAPRSID